MTLEHLKKHYNRIISFGMQSRMRNWERRSPDRRTRRNAPYPFSHEGSAMHANGVPFVSPGSSPRDPGYSWFGHSALKGRDNARLSRPFRAPRLSSLLPRVSRTRPWADESGAVGAASLHASRLNGYGRNAPRHRKPLECANRKASDHVASGGLETAAPSYRTRSFCGCTIFKNTLLLVALAASLPAACLQAATTIPAAATTTATPTTTTTATPAQQQIATAMRRAFDWQSAPANRTTTAFPVESPQGPRGWVHGAFMTGVLEAARTTGYIAYLDYAWKIAEGNSWQLGPRFEHGDDHIIAQSYLELREIDPARANIKPTIETFDRLLAKHYDGAKLLWWCDSLYMHPQVWARLAKATGNPKYLDEMDRLYWESVDYLYDKDERLFFRDKNYMPHDKDFKPERANKKTGRTERFTERNGKKMFWSRGNGWVFAGLPRIMNYIPKDDPRRAKYETLFTQMAARIAALQSPDGLWRMGLLDPDAYGAGEESGSAFFVYGLAWGVRTGLLDATTYMPAVERGWRALLACQQPDGMIGFVQPIGAAPGEHSAKTFQEYGAGGFLLAGSEMFKLTTK